MSRQTLTTKQLLFIQHFSGNATDAAKAAGYANPMQQGSRLMSHSAIKKAIEQKLTAVTVESARRTIRRITFGRNDIIGVLADLAGLGAPEKVAENESVKRAAARDLADIFQLTKPSGKDTDFFAGWTEEEMEYYRRTDGEIPPSRLGLSTEVSNHNGKLNDNPGFSTGGALATPERPPLGSK